MSNKRIDLWSTSFDNFFHLDESSHTFEKYDILASCDYNEMYKLPKFATKCLAHNIKPLCGVKFGLETPEDCLTDVLHLVCYAEDEDGCEALQFLYSRSDDGRIKYEDFCKFSNHLQVGLDIIFSEVDMIIIDNILEYVFIPDFVLIDINQGSFRSWEKCRRKLEDKGVLICGSGFPMSCTLDDETVLEDFNFLGNRAYEYVIENPRKIADRITGDLNFDVALITKIRDSRATHYCRVP